VVLAVAVRGGVTAMIAERWHCEATAPVAAVVRLPARRDCPTLEREVASPVVSRSW
jgi:hypothetical protein